MTFFVTTWVTLGRLLVDREWKSPAKFPDFELEPICEIKIMAIFFLKVSQHECHFTDFTFVRGHSALTRKLGPRPSQRSNELRAEQIGLLPSNVLPTLEIILKKKESSPPTVDRGS